MSGFTFHALVGMLGGLALTAGYLFGLRRFAGRARRELEEARSDADRAIEETAAARAAAAAKAATDAAALADAHATAAAKAIAAPSARRSPTVTHTVLLDGVSNSGKSTLVHRLAFPCTEQESLRRIAATQRAYPTRLLPICFVPSTGDAGADAPVLHAQILRDIAGERPGDVINIVNELAAERARPADADNRPGAVIAVLIWDMADTAGSRARINKDRLKLAYHNDHARRLIKHFVIFFNKLDLLAVTPEHAQQLVEDERAHLEHLTDFFDSDVTRTYLQGSALRGDGVVDCQGAIYTALGLAPYFRVVERDAKAP